MTTQAIERSFRDKVCAEVRLAEEGLDRYRVFTPFIFNDGDHLSIVLRQEGQRWVLADEGHTYMHLSYDIDEKDLERGTRQKIIANVLSTFQVIDEEGELRLPIPDEQFGDALYSYIQALLKVTDVTYLTRERVRSTFLEDFKELLHSKISEGRMTFDWHDPEHDPQGIYPVDCRVNGIERPLFIYALPNDDRVRDATIGLLKFEQWGINMHSIGIFEDQEKINRKVLSRFTDVCEKQFSTLSANRERIAQYLHEMMRS